MGVRVLYCVFGFLGIGVYSTLLLPLLNRVFTSRATDNTATASTVPRVAGSFLQNVRILT